MTIGSSWFMKIGKKQNENTVVADAGSESPNEAYWYMCLHIFYVAQSRRVGGGSGKLWKIYGVKNYLYLRTVPYI